MPYPDPLEEVQVDLCWCPKDADYMGKRCLIACQCARLNWDTGQHEARSAGGRMREVACERVRQDLTASHKVRFPA